MKYSRYLLDKILKRFKDQPVVLIIGSRQSGKTTIVDAIAKRETMQFVSLDSLGVFEAAKTDPQGFIEGFSLPVVLDEVQRVPELFLPIKYCVDQKRENGAFILTGSADPMHLPRVADSLAGRMVMFQLWPLSQGEIEGRKEGFIDALFADEWSHQSVESLSNESLAKRMILGGYPAVVQSSSSEGREDWCAAYLKAVLQKDVRDLAEIDHLVTMPNLLKLLAARASSLLNVAELSRSTQLPYSTLRRYLTLLQTLFMVHIQYPWHTNLSKRLVKSPKAYLADTGLLCYLLGLDEQHLLQKHQLYGAILENFVVVELQKQAGWSRTRVDQYHYRTQAGNEVDILLENRRHQVVGIEVKASHTLRTQDFKQLQLLQEELGERFLRGIVLYTGQEMYPISKDIYAVPIQALWQVTA